MTIRLKPQNPGPLWKFFTSVWLAVGMMLWVGFICAIGTSFVREAEVVFFKAKWFVIFLVTLMVNISIATLNRASKPLYEDGQWQFPWRLSQLPFLCVHAGLLTLFTGGIITAVAATSAQLHLSEAPPTKPTQPPQMGQVLLKQKRMIQVRALLPDSKKADYVGYQSVFIAKKDGDEVRGRVTQQIGSNDSGSLVLETENGQVPISRDEISGIAVTETHPVHLTHVNPTDDLGQYQPRHFILGLSIAVLFIVLSAFLGRYFNDDSAPLMTTFAFCFLAVAFYLEWPEFKQPVLNNKLELRYKKYYPHYEMKDLVTENPKLNPAVNAKARNANAAVKLMLGPEIFWLFENQQPQNVTVDDKEPLMSPIEYGNNQVNFLTLADKSKLESYTAAQKDNTGSVEFFLRSDPSKSLRIKGSELTPDKVIDFGGKSIKIIKVYGSFRVRQVEGPKDNNHHGPHKPGEDPHSKGSGLKFEPFDSGGLVNPAVEYVIEGETEPRYAFAWYPQLNDTLAKNRKSHADIGVVYERPRNLGAQSITIFKTCDDNKHFVLFRAPGQADKLAPIDVGGSVHHELKGHLILLDLQESICDAQISREVVPVTEKTRTNFKDYPDAIYVELVDPANPPKTAQDAVGGWLKFGSQLPLTHGDTRLVVFYTFQREKMPFKIRLNKFEIEHHPGTAKPSEFRSTVTVFDQTKDGQNKQFDAQIFMNHTLDYRGYRFFQSSYSTPKNQPVISVFSVSKNPGTPVFYGGCIILCFGVFVIFFVKPSLIKIEKRLARVAAGLPAEGPLTKDMLDSARKKNRDARAKDTAAVS